MSKANRVYDLVVVGTGVAASTVVMIGYYNVSEYVS
jgi:hypothetical protein